jgi:GNAT superfamily N-acetyltransferase
MWVAEDGAAGVVGFVGLMIEGRAGEVNPIVVTSARRGRGIGRAMLAKVVEEARRRGLSELSVSPPTRDRSALRALHAAGFATVSSVTVSYDLRGRAGASGKESTLDLFDLDFHV